MTLRVAALAIGLLALGLGSARGQDGVPEPDGYRTEDYRTPTPTTLKGARVVTTAEAVAIWQAGGAVFVDVLPRPPRPAGLPAGTVWRDRPRRNIPGGIWLPDTGYGALAEAAENYLRTGLDHASGGDRKRTLVFYCLKDCWMSWNAAKRAVAMGYVNVVWFPAGTDGWEEAGLPLAEAQPAEGRPELTPAPAGSSGPAQTGAAR
jgi:PQQ-dependent catabolism-associated CXXCW motif protein